MSQSVNERKLSLDRLVTYKIRVPGQIDRRWSKVYDGMTIETTNDLDEVSISVLTCTLDQAALQGLLRRLYSSGIPLISVEMVTDM